MVILLNIITIFNKNGQTIQEIMTNYAMDYYLEAGIFQLES